MKFARKNSKFNFLMKKLHAELNVAETGGTKLDKAIRTVYSKEIEFKALPNMRFFQFATMKTELGTQPGLTIEMLTYDNIARGGKLTEGTKMVGKAMSSSMKSIKVYEYGNSITVSQLLIQASFDDVMASATALLGRDYAIVLDTELRDTALSGTNVVYASKKDGTKVSARTDLVEGCTLKVSTIKDAIEILATNNAPKYNNESWICFVHPHQSRGIRDDHAWINASNYGAPELQFIGEIGRIDDTRFIETTLMCNGACSTDDPAHKNELKTGVASNQVNVYQALIFGDRYYALAVSLPVELRDNGIMDYGRERGLAWYSIFGTGLLNEEYGVVIETA